MDEIFSPAAHVGAGSFGGGIIVYQATVLAIGQDPRWDTSKWFYVGDGFGTVPVSAAESAEVGDRVMFSVTQYEGWSGVPLAMNPGSWRVTSHDNPVAVHNLGASTVDYTEHYSELVHAAGEILGASDMNCGTGYTCFVFEHNGVRDRIRVPRLNNLGLDVDYDGGLCGEVVAPAGIYQDSSGVQGYFIDVAQSDWIRTWPAP